MAFADLRPKRVAIAFPTGQAPYIGRWDTLRPPSERRPSPDSSRRNRPLFVLATTVSPCGTRRSDTDLVHGVVSPAAHRAQEAKEGLGRRVPQRKVHLRSPYYDPGEGCSRVLRRG